MTIAENSQTATRIIRAVRTSLIDMAMNDIHRSLGKNPRRSIITPRTELQNGVHPIAASFILACCLIEAAGHFALGPTPPNVNDSRWAFDQFCSKYLLSKGYDPLVLYKATRCGLAHNYTSTGNDFRFRDQYRLVHNRPSAHLQQHANDAHIRYLNAQNFISDVDNTVHSFLTDVENNFNHEQRQFLDWAETSGWLQVFMSKDGTSLTAQIGTTGAPPVIAPRTVPIFPPRPTPWNAIPAPIPSIDCLLWDKNIKYTGITAPQTCLINCATGTTNISNVPYPPQVVTPTADRYQLQPGWVTVNRRMT